MSTVNLLLNCTSTLLYVCVCCACESINYIPGLEVLHVSSRSSFLLFWGGGGAIFGRSNGTNPGLKLLIQFILLLFQSIVSDNFLHSV